MSDIEINKALAASGECDGCEGRGYTLDRDEGGVLHENHCGSCDGTGRDPHAQLRATQAVGHLLLRLLDRAERQ